ncbi:MAG: two pore domain potassium channel family protein, partial [Theionarchaea archaeon]|nr:two pore domain potassium channel family protein [Theionarchaea archaeon]
ILKNPIGIEVESLPTSIYYSVATYFSLGYGDICPTGWVRLISMLEVSIGYFMTIFIVSMGVTKYGLEKGELRRT